MADVPIAQGPVEYGITQYLEPDGGNVYRPHKLMVTSGQFWRCAHGLTNRHD